MKRTMSLGLSLALAASFLPFNARAGTPTPLSISVPLSGSVPLALAAAQRLGVYNAPMTVTVALRYRNEAGLQELLHGLYTPGSPSYHHWLTSAQFARAFDPTPATQRAVVAWLRSRGLQAAADCGSLMVSVRASASALSDTFGTPIERYRLGSQTFYANMGPVQVPASLAPAISSVTGLSSLAIHPLSRPHRTLRDNSPQPFGPSDLASAYDFGPLYKNNVLGQGETIAVPEFTQVSDANIGQFDSNYGLPAPQLVRVPVTVGGQTGGQTYNTDEESEAEIDIEVAHGMAPDATILVYQGPDNTDEPNVMCQIIADNKANVISTSYGAAENTLDADGMNTEDAFFQQAAAQGMTVTAASGDNGAYDKDKIDYSKDPLQVDFPSSDPWVTGVGGTSITVNGDGSITETAWNHKDENAGSGGGLSTFWAKPAWQTGPGVANNYSNGKRQVPDVAALADSDEPGYNIYTYDGGQTGWQTEGGTSAASPLWGAYVALLDQVLGKRIGFMNPLLYQIGTAYTGTKTDPFFDITQGNNLYYPATPGWDFTTGWGSPDAARLTAVIGTGVPQVPKPTIKCKKGYKLVNGKCVKKKKKH